MNYPNLLSIIGCIVLFAKVPFAQDLSAQNDVVLEPDVIAEGCYQLIVPNIKLNGFELSDEQKRAFKAIQLEYEDTTIYLENEVDVRIMSKAKEQEGVFWIKYSLK